MSVITDHLKESKLHLEYLLSTAKRRESQEVAEFLESHGVPEAIERADVALEYVIEEELPDEDDLDSQGRVK